MMPVTPTQSPSAASTHTSPDTLHDDASAPIDRAALPPGEPPTPSLLRFPVVGIGASAGCVAALVALFRNLPADTGIAFVVVVHLSAQHESVIHDILAKATPMPVRQVRGRVAIEPSHVYVISPALQLTMNNGHLHVADLERPLGRAVAIDVFFRTLAEVQQERALCVVLSGTGSDGAVGLRRIKERGGLTLVQTPDDAEYSGMPTNAIATGCVDVVLPAVAIGPKLVELWANMRQIRLPEPAADLMSLVETPPTDSAAAQAEAALAEVMTLLRSRTGHDFGHYKRATVLRRLERRLQVNGIPDLPAYRDLLRRQPAEADSLLKDLLISVTNFFRDREAFDALERELGNRLQQRGASHGSLRAWVAGCATGEEAYSVAMLMTERIAALRLDLKVQVFASDIDERALAVGRTGLYPDSIITDVTPARLLQFFDKEEANVRVRKDLRERVVFATHSVLRDPPFSQLDLVSCRNLLIYLDREVQVQVLETFHFALRPGGLLFLGNSEGMESVRDLFVPVDEKQRIYRAHGVRPGGRTVPSLPAADRALLAIPYRPPADRRGSLTGLHERARETHAPASVLVDEAGHILHSTSRAAGFLRFVAGAPSQNLLDLVRVDLRLELHAALIQAWQKGESVQARTVGVQDGGPGPSAKTSWIAMTVHPVANPGRPLMLVLFDRADSTLGPEAMPGANQDPVQVMLEEELRRTREQLHGTLGESAASTDELRASNEELQAINEELHSATEELETSKEELQSVNEEMVTVNQELMDKVAETSRVNDDLQNLIASTDIASVFVDRDMRIKRFTPSASRLFNLLDTDVGRSLLDITHRLDYDLLEQDAVDAFRSLQMIEREVTGEGDSRFLVRVRPYRTQDDVIDGAAITFVDVTAVRHAEERMRAGEANLQFVAESTQDYAIVTTDTGGKVTGWNQGAQRMFGYQDTEIIGTTIDVIFTPEDRDGGMPQIERASARENGRALDERWHLRKNGEPFYCSGITTPLREHGRLVGFAKIARDQTKHKRAERQLQALLLQEKETRAELQRAITLKDEFLAVMSHELKQPLNLIHINAELMARLPEVRQAPAVARAADIIRRAVLSQSKIIDDLLDLSRLRTGKFGLTTSALDWRGAANKVLDAVTGDLRAQNLAMFRDVDGGPVWIKGDPVRVEQIVWNLVSNALKFTPSGGTISVLLTLDAPMARLDVIDSGQGIAPDFIADIFDMFRQADRSTTRPQGGMGIGLALVRQLAEAQGGKVAVVSGGIGQGAHFSVWLPLVEAVPGDAAGRPPLPALAGLQVLAVDDTLDALESFASLLRLEGAEVTAVTSASAALGAIERGHYDVLLSDVAMPGMDGYELIATLRENAVTRDLPAIALTGFGRPQDAEKALAAGFDAHLAKPVVVEELLQTVARLLVLRRSRRAPEAG